MIPITKNIRILDEQGNEYGATYPKRAKGLVKNGRARFIDENTICLACPPNIILEDNLMDNNINAGVKEQQSKLTLVQILQRIDKIIDDTAYLSEAVEAIKQMEGFKLEPYAPQDARPSSIAEIVKAREKTNQQTLRILENMYDDLNPERPDREAARFAQISDTITELMDYSTDAAADILKGITKEMFG